MILYGPPASGKDTITDSLHRIDSRCAAFRRLKVAASYCSAERYRPVTAAELTRLHAIGQVVYENARYGNVYVVDRPGLDRAFAHGVIPVVHLGQLAGVRAVRRYPARWLPVLLWCPRAVSEHRLRDRGSRDIDDRLIAWQETERDLAGAVPDDFALRIDTDRYRPDNAARTIFAELIRLTESVQGAGGGG